MYIFIGLIGLLGVAALAAAAVVAYRWNGARPPAAGSGAHWPAELSDPDTQAGRI